MSPLSAPLPSRAWSLSLAVLLAVAACASGEAAQTPQAQNRSQHELLRGYHCTQSALAGRYSCARSLDRQAQRQAAARAAATCPSCDATRAP